MDTAEKFHGTLKPMATAQVLLRQPIIRAMLLLGIFAVVMQTPPLLAQTDPLQPFTWQAPNFQLATSVQLATSIRTDKTIYKPGERVRISGKVFNTKGDFVPGGFVELQVDKKAGNQAATAEASNGHSPAPSPALSDPLYRVRLELRAAEFSDDGFTIKPFEGNGLRDYREHYVVSATAHYARSRGTGDGVPSSSKGDGEPSRTHFAAEEFGWSKIMWIFLPPLGGALVFLAVLLKVFMMVPTKRAATWALWLVFAGGLIFLVGALLMPTLISFSPGVEALIRTTPVGIAKVTTKEMGNLQWTLNIGGAIDAEKNMLKGGFSVPLFVLTLGLVGAVISMLMKLPECLQAYDAITPAADNEAPSVSTLREAVFKYFVYILTGPFLGMMVYSLVAIMDYTNELALSIMAFSVGFTADRIVETLLTVAGNILSQAQSVREPRGQAVPTAAGPGPSQAPAVRPATPTRSDSGPTSGATHGPLTVATTAAT